MKKLAILFLLLGVIGLMLGNTPAKIDFLIIENGKTVYQNRYDIDYLGDIYLNSLSRGDFDTMSKRCGGETAALSLINKSILDDIAAYLMGAKIEPIDASIRYSDKKFDFIKEKCGAFVDEAELLSSIKYSNGRLVATVSTKPLEPLLTLDEISTWTDKIASFSTDYSTSSDSRKHNIRLAAKALDGYTLKRGGTMSFNAIVGDRTAARGYQDANIILNGEFVSGIGGGVCQVSTTLYNTALRSGLTIKSASAHTLPVSYVDKGYDAMVSAATDLIIYNDTPADVFFDIKTTDTAITMTTYSKKSEYNQDIHISTVTEKIIEASYDTVLVDKLDSCHLPYEKVLKPKKDGYIVSTYITKNNKKTKLRTSHYKASNGILEKTNPDYQPETPKANNS